MNIRCLFVPISFCFRCPPSLLPQDFTLKKINLPLNYQVDQSHPLPNIGGRVLHRITHIFLKTFLLFCIPREPQCSFTADLSYNDAQLDSL